MATDRVVLFTQTLQNDFVRKLAPGEPLPNLLHVGREESRRLLGDDPAEGPLARFLRAFAAGSRQVSVHIRDWHSTDDLVQRAHLAHFGEHCVRGSEGARFIAPVEGLIEGSGGGAIVIDSPGLTDFEGTPLAARLRELIGAADLPRAKVGIVGVWTDVKVQYLAYELATRLGIEQIAVSSALVASRSRARHRAALEHLREMLGVLVFDSIPEFLAWLEVDATAAVVPTRAARFGTEVVTREGEVPLEEDERALVSYLFRNSRRVTLARLGGGFSGSRVYRTRSEDGAGRAEVPYVVKVDTHARIAQERVGVESVESLLGPASPTVADYVDGPSLGAVKYGFASMNDSETRTLLARLRAAGGPEEVRHLFAGVLRVLERLHQAPQPERVQLFRHFTYRPEYAEEALARARAVAGDPADPRVRALERFYARLDGFLDEEPCQVAVSLIHGDLNLANLLLDDAGNTWLIDYFWTRPGPLLQDVLKLANDVRFVAFAADDPSGRRETALEVLERYLTDALGGPLDGRTRRIAALRYAAHSLSFDECDAAQKAAALTAAAEYATALASGV